MAWVALNCPQCSAPLPRVALWRAVKCESCGALITKTESMVMRDTFRQALKRARQSPAASGLTIRCGGHSYSSTHFLGSGEISQVHVARRIGALPCLVTIKLSSASNAAARYAHEADVLRQLQQPVSGPAAACLTQRLPEVVAQGANEANEGQQALVLRYPSGYWGSLSQLNERQPQGLDPRHSVWIWRRMLDILGFIHSLGWAHGDIRPEHALVHPKDHGIRLIGWASARKAADPKAQATDLLRSARVMQVLLGGTNDAGSLPAQVPEELAQLVVRSGQDVDFCRSQGSKGLDASLRAAALTAFGPPKFVHLTL